MNTSYCITKLPKSPKSYGRPVYKMEPKVFIKVPPTTTFTNWGELNKEDIDDILDWIYKDEEDLQPLLT